MTRALFIVVACLGLAACEVEDGGVDPQPLEGEVEAGGAMLDGNGFVALLDGADAELVPGAQGGFHVWINVRVQGVAGPLYLERTARRVSDDALVLAGSRRALEIPDDAMDSWWESPEATPSFMCPSPIGIKVFDQELTFTVRVLDRDDAVLAEDELIVVPRCPTGEHADFCARICSG